MVAAGPITANFPPVPPSLSLFRSLFLLSVILCIATPPDAGRRQPDRTLPPSLSCFLPFRKPAPPVPSLSPAFSLSICASAGQQPAPSLTQTLFGTEALHQTFCPHSSTFLLHRRRSSLPLIPSFSPTHSSPCPARSCCCPCCPNSPPIPPSLSLLSVAGQQPARLPDLGLFVWMQKKEFNCGNFRIYLSLCL